MALYVFRSKAAGEILMLEQPARRLLAILGREDAPRGVIRAGEIEAALQRLDAAVAAEAAELAAQRAQGAPAPEDDDSVPRMTLPVSLRQRAWPLQQMLRAAHERAVDVTWGI